MFKFYVLMMLILTGSYVLYRRYTISKFKFISLTPYASGEKFITMDVKKRGLFWSKERRYIGNIDNKEQEWFENDTMKGLAVDTETNTVLRELYFANNGRVGFDDKHPSAHLS